MNEDRGWEIYPRMIYDMAMRLKNEYGNVEWLVTENGMGVMKEGRFRNGDGMIEDDYRIDFIRRHLAWTLRAVEDGANCRGYLLWAFTDCVSPMNAFKNRYGLIEIDLGNDRARRMKKSGIFYRELSEQRVLMVEEREVC